MATTRVPVTGSVLRWALDEAGLTEADLAAQLRTDPEIVDAWLRGDASPTQGDLTRLSKVLRRPSALFFLPEPPRRHSVPPRFRLGRGRKERPLVPEELREIRRAKRLQHVVAWLRREREEGSPSVPEVARGSAPAVVAANLRRWMGVTVDEQLRWDTAREGFESWRWVLEGRRLLVFQLQLGSRDIRGFASFDEWAPLVAVNTADNYPARTFTLFHEVAHLAVRDDASCLTQGLDAVDQQRDLERWCEQVAAQTLLPADDVRRVVARLRSAARPPDDDFALARRLAGTFGVSIRAAAIRLIELQAVGGDLYAEVEDRAQRLDRMKGGGGGGGQPAPGRRLAEVGPRTAGLLLDAMEQRTLNERDVRDYLRLDGAELDELRGRLGSTV